MKHISKLGISTLVLVVSGFICKLLGAFFRFPLTNLIGIEGIGIFQLVMSLYSFSLVVASGGITVTLSKLISSARAVGDEKRVQNYLFRALFSGIGIGLILGIFFVLFGNIISSFQGVDVGGSYFLFIVLLPLGAGLASMRGFFQGYENMFPTAISQIIEQVIKFIMGILFASIFVKNGISKGVFGAFLGITLSELLAFIYIFILYLFKNKNFEIYRQNKMIKREFDKVNFTLMLSASIIPLTNAIDSLFIVSRLVSSGITNEMATKLYGLQTGIVGAILNFPLIISLAVTTAYLPNITYLISRKVEGKLMIEKGLKILLFLILPTTFGIIAISKPFLLVMYSDVSEFLEITFLLMFYGGFSIIFTALMQYFIMLLQAHGEFRFILIITILGGLIKLSLTFFLSSVSIINIFSLVIGNIFLSSFVCVMAIWKLKKMVGFSIFFPDIFSILFATLMMFLAVYSFVLNSNLTPILNIIIGTIMGIFIYGILTIPFIIKFYPKKIKEKV